MVEVPVADMVRDWPTVVTKVSPQMKAHIIEALHKDGWTLSMSEYIRVILANHVAEVLDMSPAQVIYQKPKVGAARKGTRWLQVG